MRASAWPSQLVPVPIRPRVELRGVHPASDLRGALHAFPAFRTQEGIVEARSTSTCRPQEPSPTSNRIQAHKKSEGNARQTIDASLLVQQRKKKLKKTSYLYTSPRSLASSLLNAIPPVLTALLSLLLNLPILVRKFANHDLARDRVAQLFGRRLDRGWEEF